jgi:sulfur-oxidizing protein SoxZ
MARALITLPATARRGEIIEIRTLIAHTMETGYRTGADGHPLPRDLIRRFRCDYAGETVFSTELFAAIATNPYIVFHTVATDSGTLSFVWEGDNGFVQTETRTIVVA